MYSKLANNQGEANPEPDYDLNMFGPEIKNNRSEYF